MKLLRDVTIAECHWLDEDPGIAVSREPGKNPFFEVPRDAVSSPRESS